VATSKEEERFNSTVSMAVRVGFGYLAIFGMLAGFYQNALIFVAAILFAVVIYAIVYFFWVNPSLILQLINRMSISDKIGFIRNFKKKHNEHAAKLSGMEADMIRIRSAEPLVPISAPEDLILDSPIYFMRSDTVLLRYSKASETGTMYLTNHSIEFVSGITYEILYSDIGIIRYNDEEAVYYSNKLPYTTMTVMLLSGKNANFYIPAATEKLMDAYMNRLIMAYKHQTRGVGFDIPITNECPRCGALLNAGRCEYCRWQAPVKQQEYLLSK
jgi:hypothetical protein